VGVYPPRPDLGDERKVTYNERIYTRQRDDIDWSCNTSSAISIETEFPSGGVKQKGRCGRTRNERTACGNNQLSFVNTTGERYSCISASVGRKASCCHEISI